MQEKFISEGNNVTGDDELMRYLSSMNCKKMYNAYFLPNKLIVNEFLDTNLIDYITYDYQPDRKETGEIFFEKAASFYQIQDRKMMQYYNLEEEDIFKRYRGLGSDCYFIGRDNKYNSKLLQYNPIDVQYYRSDESSAFDEYNEIFGIDINVSFPSNYMIKKYKYDKSILVKNESGGLAASFEYDRIDDYHILLADFPDDQYILIFEKNGDLPTVTHKIEYIVDTKCINIFQRVRPVTINDIPIIGDYDNLGYPRSSYIAELDDGGRLYKVKNLVPFTIRDCMYLEPTDCMDVVKEVDGAIIIVRYILPSEDEIITSN